MQVYVFLFLEGEGTLLISESFGVYQQWMRGGGLSFCQAFGLEVVLLGNLLAKRVVFNHSFCCSYIHYYWKMVCFQHVNSFRKCACAYHWHCHDARTKVLQAEQNVKVMVNEACGLMLEWEFAKQHIFCCLGYAEWHLTSSLIRLMI